LPLRFTGKALQWRELLAGAAQAEEVCSRIKNERGKAVAVQADVTLQADVRAMVKKTEASLGPIDILVNNAGHNPLPRYRLHVGEGLGGGYHSQFEVLLSGLKAVLESMVKRKTARIINITSISGQRADWRVTWTTPRQRQES